jgi:hypothetical protein
MLLPQSCARSSGIVGSYDQSGTAASSEHPVNTTESCMGDWERREWLYTSYKLKFTIHYGSQVQIVFQRECTLHIQVGVTALQAALDS